MMTNSSEYKLIVSNNPRDLAAEVTEAMRDEWDLYGNPFYTGSILVGSNNGPQRGMYCQAVVRLPHPVMSQMNATAVASNEIFAGVVGYVNEA